MNIKKYLVIIIPFLFPLASRADDSEQGQSNGVAIATIGERKVVNQMAVYPQGGIAKRPLLIMAHGNDGSGPKEIEGWITLARQHNFTIVCPTFLSAANSMYLPEDKPYFEACLRWIEDNLQYDHSNVYMTGFSGGDYAVWYLATARPDFFRGLFLQSGNFAGDDYYNLELPPWHDKPIHLVWGSEDSPTVTEQNQRAAGLLRSLNFTNSSCEIISGAHHEPHHDLVVTWMEQQVAANPRN